MPSDALETEQRNLRSERLDRSSIPEILAMINEEDQRVARAIAGELPRIAQAVEMVVACFRRGGRLFLCGAGTSGRIAASEAAECPPTFSTSPELVQSVIAGGPQALLHAQEGAEDDAGAGVRALQERGVNALDVLLGISASGRTPFVLGALAEARQRAAATILLTANAPGGKSPADLVIAPATGPEILTGSTRLKAGSAAKMVLNMITTTAMAQWGKVYQNLMVDLSPNSRKLVERAVRIVCNVTGCSEREAQELIAATGNAKVAMVMHCQKVSAAQAREMLKQNPELWWRLIETHE